MEDGKWKRIHGGERREGRSGRITNGHEKEEEFYPQISPINTDFFGGEVSPHLVVQQHAETEGKRGKRNLNRRTQRARRREKGKWKGVKR
jgi:hypothetical protein